VFFGVNVTEKEGNQKVDYFFPPHLTTDSSKMQKHKCCIIALPDFNQSLA